MLIAEIFIRSLVEKYDKKNFDIKICINNYQDIIIVNLDNKKIYLIGNDKFIKVYQLYINIIENSFKYINKYIYENYYIIR